MIKIVDEGQLLKRYKDRYFRISKIEITKNELFDFFYYFECMYNFFICLNYSVTQNI